MSSTEPKYLLLLDELSESLVIFSKHHENIYIFGDFNATPEN